MELTDFVEHVEFMELAKLTELDKVTESAHSCPVANPLL